MSYDKSIYTDNENEVFYNQQQSWMIEVLDYRKEDTYVNKNVEIDAEYSQLDDLNIYINIRVRCV